MKFHLKLLCLFGAVLLYYGEANAQSIEYDSVFVRSNRADSHDTINYVTDTILFPSQMFRHMLIGTTVLPYTQNQMAAHGFGIMGLQVTKSDCQMDRTYLGGGLDKINSIQRTDSTILVDINITDNCCYDFLCDVSVDSAGIMHLLYTGYGTHCACECCFGLVYQFELYHKEDTQIIRGVMINEDRKTLQVFE